MRYYILLPDDTEEDCKYSDNNILGEISFNKWYPGLGFKILEEKAFNNQDLSDLRIKDERGKDYTIEEFLEVLEKGQK